jgi:hypothetical protein
MLNPAKFERDGRVSPLSDRAGRAVTRLKTTVLLGPCCPRRSPGRVILPP